MKKFVIPEFSVFLVTFDHLLMKYPSHIYNFEVIFTALPGEYNINITFQAAAAQLIHIFRVLFMTF